MALPRNYYERRAGCRGVLAEYLPATAGQAAGGAWRGVWMQERFRAGADRFVSVTCETCGARFLRERRRVLPGKRLFCSNRCFSRRDRTAP